MIFGTNSYAISIFRETITNNLTFCLEELVELINNNMKINVFKKAFHSFLLVASLTFGCFQLSSCSSSNDDTDNVLTHSYQEEMWEKVTGLSYSDISKVNLFGCSKPAYLPYKNQDFTTNDKYAYTFYGIKNKKFWIVAYEPNVFSKNNMDNENGYHKVFEWTDSKDFDFDKRISKYTTITTNEIICNILVLKKEGFALSLSYSGHEKENQEGKLHSLHLLKRVKNGTEKDSTLMFGDVNFLRPWYGDYFVKDQKLLNIDNCSEYSFWDWDWNWESIALDEVISIKPLSRLKLRFDNNAIYKGDLIWEIKDEDVAKKLNIKLGEKDKISYELLKKVDEHSWKYKAHVVYDDWDTPDADYEILVDIDKGELK